MKISIKVCLMIVALCLVSGCASFKGDVDPGFKPGVENGDPRYWEPAPYFGPFIF